MTSLLDRPITAASDDGVCRWHATKLWQTRAKLLKLNLIWIISCTTSKKRTKTTKKYVGLCSLSSPLREHKPTDFIKIFGWGKARPKEEDFRFVVATRSFSGLCIINQDYSPLKDNVHQMAATFSAEA